MNSPRDNFKATVFIDIGEHGHFYTLRETYLHEKHIPGEGPMGNAVLNGVYQGTVEHEIRSIHIKNLSQDPDEAFEKAVQYAGSMKLRLTTARQDLQGMLEEVKRRSAEEMEEAIRLERLGTARRNLGYSQDRDYQIMANLAHNGGIHHFAFGKHAGERISDVAKFDRDYLEFLAGKMAEDDNPRYDNSLTLAQIQAALEAVEPPPESQYFGEVGKRSNGIVATIKDAKLIQGYSYSYYDSGEKTLYTLITDAGEILVMFTTASLGQRGEKLRFNAMIKKHEEYRDVRQTTISRATKVEVLA